MREAVSPTDTIAAIATPPGHGGIGIVRISGPHVPTIAQTLLNRIPPPRMATFGAFRDHDGVVIDNGIALYFPAPHSFTGEDVLELQGHGGPAVLQWILSATIRAGARSARPGEFSERAFLNDKLDLTQAEAIADLIASTTQAAARAALRSLQGDFSRKVHQLAEQLIHARVLIEAGLDFPDEEIEVLEDVRGTIGVVIAQTTDLLHTAQQGRLLRDGMTVVIAGQPNVGKSSLLNHLAGCETAIVTAIPGTTRDVLRETVSIHGIPVHLVDTAGLRDSADVVEQEGIRRAWSEMASADHILLMVEDAAGCTVVEEQWRTQWPVTTPITIVRNKIDCTGENPGMCERQWGTEIRLSAKTGVGVELLCDHLTATMGYTAAEGTWSARRRHVEALEKALAALYNARAQSDIMASECVAEELRVAHNALGEITGAFTSEDLLDNIFSQFCMGK